MKAFKIVLSFVVLTFLVACDEDSPSKEEKFIRKLRFTWSLEGVTVDGKNVTNSFPNLTLTVDKKKTYTVANPVSPIWAASGTFEFEKVPNSDLFNIIRDDGIHITVTELTETTLKYKLTYVASGGRTKSVSGDYEFSMSK